MINFINLTPHNITVQKEDGLQVTFSSQGVARVATSNTIVKNHDGITLSQQEFGAIEGLPSQKDDTLYIVSFIVREAALKVGRTDCISPDSSPSGAIRDENGNIVAVKGFIV